MRSAVVRDAPGESAGNATVRLNLLVSGLFAWTATVAVPTFANPGPASVVCASLALLALVGGLAAAPRFPKLGRAVTMVGFLGFSAVTWLALGAGLEVQRLEPVRAASGAVGWMLFAFGWGSVRNVRSVPEEDPRVIAGEPLPPRQALPPFTQLVFAVSVLGALVPWLAAWRVVRPEHALLTHAVALLCAIAMVSVGAQVAVRRSSRWASRSPAQRVNSAATSLAGLAVVGVFGIVVWWVRR